MRAYGWVVASLEMRAYAQWMGLTLAQRRAITGTFPATRYQQASKRGKGRILDELCVNTGWHRNHARKAFKAALQPKSIQEPQPAQEGQEAGVVSLRLTSDYERVL
ncbi:hypothetical protein MOKP4_15620 [Mycobacterium avium subsp. hominissuis]